MVTKELSDIIQNFERKYSITFSDSAVNILIEGGLDEQLATGEVIDFDELALKYLGGDGWHSQLARVFILEYINNSISKTDVNSVKHWLSVLGGAKYHLGKLEEEPAKRNWLFNKSLDDLLTARAKGHITQQNANLIGRVYSKLGEYGEAVNYLIESKNLGNNDPKNMRAIGECYIKSKRPTMGTNWYETALQTAKQKKFDPEWMYEFDIILEDSFNILTESKESISAKSYSIRLQAFKRFYAAFTEYWRENTSETIPFRLDFDVKKN